MGDAQRGCAKQERVVGMDDVRRKFLDSRSEKMGNRQDHGEVAAVEMLDGRNSDHVLLVLGLILERLGRVAEAVAVLGPTMEAQRRHPDLGDLHHETLETTTHLVSVMERTRACEDGARSGIFRNGTVQAVRSRLALAMLGGRDDGRRLIPAPPRAPTLPTPLPVTGRNS